jgi:hypothetical protein
VNGVCKIVLPHNETVIQDSISGDITNNRIFLLLHRPGAINVGVNIGRLLLTQSVLISQVLMHSRLDLRTCLVIMALVVVVVVVVVVVDELCAFSGFYTA